MEDLKYTDKQKELIKQYEHMHSAGYSTRDDLHVKDAYDSFEPWLFREHIRPVFAEINVETILDYGAGKGNWYKPRGKTGISASDYLNVKTVLRFEPGLFLDERELSDAVICFDVLEHISLTDIATVVRDLFRYAEKLLVVNVACYPARASLPCGENAHVTVRPPMWWKGLFDTLCGEYPDTKVQLFCSTAHKKATQFPVWCYRDWLEADTFVIDQ